MIKHPLNNTLNKNLSTNKILHSEQYQHQSIRDKIHNQIMLNEKLLCYDYDDSDSNSEQEVSKNVRSIKSNINLSDSQEQLQGQNVQEEEEEQKREKSTEKISKPLSVLKNINNQLKANQQSSQHRHKTSNLNDKNIKIKGRTNQTSESMEMNEAKRRKLFEQLLMLQSQDKQNQLTNIIQQKHSKSKPKLNNRHKHQKDQTATIIDLKSKLAQLLKQISLKDEIIQQKQQQIKQKQQKIEQAKKILQQNQKIILKQQQAYYQLNLSYNQIKQNHQKYMKQQSEMYQKQINKFRQTIQQKQLEVLKWNQKILEYKQLVKFKDQEIENIKLIEKKGNKFIKENQRLRTDIKRLLQMMEGFGKVKDVREYIKGSNKKTNIKMETQRLDSIFSNKRLQSAKDSTYSSKRLRSAKHNRTKSSVFQQVGNLSRLSSYHYLSVPSKRTQNNINFSSWYPNILIDQVQSFLKKWHIGYNNKNFVNNLVQFINAYSQKCIQNTKVIMQNRFKLLKKDMKRKANECLSIEQIFRQRRKQRQRQKENSEKHGSLVNISSNKNVKKRGNSCSNNDCNDKNKKSPFRNEITFNLNQNKKVNNAINSKSIDKNNLQNHQQKQFDLMSQNISILKPATNLQQQHIFQKDSKRKGKQKPQKTGLYRNNSTNQRKKQQINCSRMSLKDEVGYKNLQKSIQRHNINKQLYFYKNIKQKNLKKNINKSFNLFKNMGEIKLKINNQQKQKQLKSKTPLKSKNKLNVYKHMRSVSSAKKRFKTQMGNQQQFYHRMTKFVD